jgi:hypothetical protein
LIDDNGTTQGRYFGYTPIEAANKALISIINRQRKESEKSAENN